MNVAQVPYFIASAKSPKMVLFGPKNAAVKTPIGQMVPVSRVYPPSPLPDFEPEGCFFWRGGVGVVYFEAPCGRNLYPLLLLYTSHP